MCLGFPSVDLVFYYYPDCYSLIFYSCDFSLCRRVGFLLYLRGLLLGGRGYELAMSLGSIFGKRYFPCL